MNTIEYRTNWDFLHHNDGDSEERAVTKCHRPQVKRVTFSEDTKGNPEGGRWCEDSGLHHFPDILESVGPVMTTVGIAGTSTHGQVPRVRNKIRTVVTCPPIVVSDKIPKKPLMGVKIIEWKRCRQNKVVPQDVLPLTSFITEEEVPANSGLVSEVNGIRDRHQPEDKETEDKQKLSNNYDGSTEKVHQLDEPFHEVNTELTCCETSVIQLEDEKRNQMQSSVTEIEDLLQQIEMQPPPLLPQNSQLEDSCGQMKKKRKKGFPLVFFRKASVMEREAQAEADKEPSPVEGAAEVIRKNCFSKMLQRIQSFMKKNTD